MKFAYLYLVLSLVFTGHFFEAQAADKLAATAAISKIDGNGVAKVRRKSGIESVAGEKQELFAGDKITTDDRSVVEVLLADGTLVRVGLNSEYRLESVEKKNGIFSWVFGLAKGSIRAMVEKNPKKDMVKFRVNTPVGTMGVRGTELVLDHNISTKVTKLYTIEGRVEFGRLKCETQRRCIEVKSGEMASIDGNSKEEPVARPANASAIFDLRNGEQGAGNNSKTLSAEEKDMLRARTALFENVKEADSLSERVASGGFDVISKGSVDEIVKKATEAMAEAQNKLLGRTMEEKMKMERAIKDGTYENRLKLAEKFDDLVSDKPVSSKEREAENLSGGKVNKKLSLAEGVLKSDAMKYVIKKAMKKISAQSNQDLEEKLAAAESLMKNAKEVAAASKKSMVTDTATSTTSATNSSTVSDTTAGTAVEPETPQEVAQAVEKLDKNLADKILLYYGGGKGEEFVRYKQYYNTCIPFTFICVETWNTVEKKVTAMFGTIERKAGICYDTKKTCKRKMIPCDLSKGRTCKPTFTEYECTTAAPVAIPCPGSSSGSGGAGAGSGTSGADN